MLFFVDESGHDRNKTPYEVRGGIAVPESKCWPLIEAIGHLEIKLFGIRLHEVGIEWKGTNVLKASVFKQANKKHFIQIDERRDLVRSFLKRQAGEEFGGPKGLELIALNQAYIAFAHGVLDLLAKFQIGIFAAVIAINAPTYTEAKFLRRDYRFLLDRFSMWVAHNNTKRSDQKGILVFDEEDRSICRRLANMLEQYCSGTESGYQLSKKIIPSPFFVYSEQTPLVQAADLCVYIINWATRAGPKMTEPIRPEMKQLGEKIKRCQRKLYKPSLKGANRPYYSIFYIETLVDARDENDAEKARVKKSGIKRKKKRGAKSSSLPHMRRQQSVATYMSSETQLLLKF